jgi:ribonuclease HI
MSKHLYTDGGYYKSKNRLMWGYIVVEDGRVIDDHECGALEGSGANDVERAEVEALRRAAEYTLSHPDNYVIHTDSKSLIDKIQKRVPNATREPSVTRIQRIISDANSSPLPQSIVLKFEKRRSNEFMKRVDDMCELHDK